MRQSISRTFGALLAATMTCGPAAAAEPIRIGVGVPLTGVDAAFGSQLRLGVEEAVKDVNAEGGLLGRQVEIDFGDDASDPKKGVRVAKHFIEAGIKIVIGHFSSAVTVPASAVYGEAKVLDIAPSATAPSVTDRGLTTVFRTCGREDQQATAAVRFLAARRYAKIAILHDRSSPGKSLADGVRKTLSDRGTSAVFYGSFADGTRDLAAIVSRIKSAGAQIVVWGGGPQGAAQLVRQLKEPRIPLLGGIGMASDDFASAAGSAADGTFTIFPRDPRRLPPAAWLVQQFKVRNIEPGGYAFYTYAAVQVLRQAADSARSLDPEKLASSMHGNQTFQTVLGPIAFNRNGDPNVTDLTVYVWHKGPSGRMEFLDPAGT